MSEAYENSLLKNDRDFYRQMARVGIPVMVQQLILVAVGICDTIMVGKLSEEALASVGAANQIFFVYIDCVFGFLSGVAVFSVQYSVGDCPWNKDNKLLVMTMQANSETDITNEGNNFVFLVDTSGSMSGELDLVKKSFKLLAGELGPNDKVSIVTYAGSSETLLEGSNDYIKICNVLDKLSASGGTNGSGGITAAYECAAKNFVKGGNNRVIIASDGDMNLGITSQSGLVDLIKEKKETGVFLTVLGYGRGNYSDANMESLADAGNGNYFYIDSINEAERVLCEKLMQTTVTVAKDVKFQVEFNPYEVASYRQIGYENRQMAAKDFNDDKKDGGEIGAGAQVTVCYELKMRDPEAKNDDGLKYQDTVLSDKAGNGEICTVSVRYKAPAEDASKLSISSAASSRHHWY